MDYSLPESSSWANMQPEATSETDKYRSKGRPGVEGTKTGGDNKYSLILSYAHWHWSSQTVGWLFLKSRKMGSQMFVNLVMNLLMYWSLPKKPLTSLSIIGANISRMALILSGSTSIPLSLTIYPKSFSEVTPKVQFLGFSLNLNYRILSKNLSKAARSSDLSQDFTIMSST